MGHFPLLEECPYGGHTQVANTEGRTDTPHGAHLLSNNVVDLARGLALIFFLFFIYN